MRVRIPQLDGDVPIASANESLAIDMKEKQRTMLSFLIRIHHRSLRRKSSPVERDAPPTLSGAIFSLRFSPQEWQ
jgi:hypothetical protein